MVSYSLPPQDLEPSRPEEPESERFAWLEERLAFLIVEPGTALAAAAKVLSPLVISAFRERLKHDPEVHVLQGDLADDWDFVPTALYPVRACNNRPFRIPLRGNGFLLNEPEYRQPFWSKILERIGLFRHVPPKLHLVPWSGFGVRDDQPWRFALEKQNDCHPDDQEGLGVLGEVPCIRLAYFLAEWGLQQPYDVWFYYVGEIGGRKKMWISEKVRLDTEKLLAQAANGRR